MHYPKQSSFFKRQLLVGLSSLIVGSSILFASNTSSAVAETDKPEIYEDQTPFENLNSRKLLSSFVKTFEKGHDYKDWYISNFVIEDDFFQVGWSANNVVFMDSGDVGLAVTHKKIRKKPYTGAEYQKKGWSQYGRYETVMVAAPGSGIVSGFFTHTNSYFKDPHDEIDIEFLGKEPKMVQFNIYRDGKNFGGKKIKLPFDTTEEFHLYAFEWTPTEVKWFIDDELVFEMTDREFDIPDAPQRLMAQVWTGNIYEWHGKPKFADGTSMVIRCVSYTQLNDENTEKCSDQPELLELSPKEISKRK